MHKEIRPDIVAKIYMYPEEKSEGGRRGTFSNTYWPGLLHFADGPSEDYWDMRLRLYEHGYLNPGDTAEIPIGFLNWDMVREEAREGRKFFICVGRRKVGEGEVLKILKKVFTY
jgi:translation elongation factor EF-Tu-like GTPase